MADKTRYQFSFSVDPQMVDGIIQNFLRANNFVYKQKDGGAYYENYDGLAGRRMLEYYFQQNSVTLYVYIGRYKKPMPLDGSVVGSAPKAAYSKMLRPLMEQLSNIQNQEITYFNQSYEQQQTFQGNAYSGMNTSVQQDPTNVFLAEADARNGKLAVVAFIISICEVILALAGVMAGAIFVLIAVYGAICGLKSDKKLLSIMALCAQVITVLIIIAQLS